MIPAITKDFLSTTFGEKALIELIFATMTTAHQRQKLAQFQFSSSSYSCRAGRVAILVAPMVDSVTSFGLPASGAA